MAETQTLADFQEPARKRVSVLGATGSIGVNTLDLIRRARPHYQVVALTAFSRVNELAAAALEFEAELAVIGDVALYPQLKERLAGSGIEVAAGPLALVEAAARPADWVMAAIMGAAGLAPALAAVRNGVVLALANKECLVCSGDLLVREAARHNSQILPVDSEHNAIFQVLDFEHLDSVEKITLTASGGPFRTFSLSAMKQASPAQAVAHPNWSMGAKISVDSATMMNKGLELIEAHTLFPIGEERFEVLVHPQSVVHSMVTYVDGSVLAQMGPPDMRTPIAFTLAWPRRMAVPMQRLDLVKVGTLTFEAPDEERFPALRLARRALQAGGGAATVLNAANEVAVDGFLRGKIGFCDIVAIVERVMDQVDAEGEVMGETSETGGGGGLEDILAVDTAVRARTAALIG